MCFLWPSFSGSHACRDPSFYSLHTLPGSAPALPWSSWLCLYATGLHPYTLPQIPAHASIAWAFISYPLVWPEVAPLLSHAGLLPYWLDFLHLGVKRSCTLWKTFYLKDLSALFCSRAPHGSSPRVLLTSPWKDGSLLTLSSGSYLYFSSDLCHISHVGKLHIVWSLQPRLPSVLMSPAGLLMLVMSGYSISPPVAGLSITWLQKLSRRLVDYLKLALLLSQWMSGWLKSPCRTRVLSVMLPITWIRRLHP